MVGLELRTGITSMSRSCPGYKRNTRCFCLMSRWATHLSGRRARTRRRRNSCQHVERCLTNPAAVLHPRVFFAKLIPTDAENKLIRGGIKRSFYDRLFAASNYVAGGGSGSASERASGCQRTRGAPYGRGSGAVGVAHMGLKEWSKALEILTSLSDRADWDSVMAARPLGIDGHGL